MKLRKISGIFLVSLVAAMAFASCSYWPQKDNTPVTSYVSFVDPFIGTGGHGHTFPGATLPFGMIQLSPDTRIDGSWDGCSGYHYSDSIIYGFSHTHLSGTGCSDYGDILLMPGIGEPSLESKDYASPFQHATEKASAGYYKVRLEKGGIDVELTATLRAGMQKYTFSKAGTGNVVIDLHHRDKTLESRLNVLDKTHIEGMRRSEAWAKDQHIYFSIEFSKPFKPSPLLLADAKEGEGITIGKDRGGVFTFDTKAGESISLKIGISTVSIEGARKNLQAEIPGWDFQQLKKDAETAWEKELSKIEVKDPDKDKLKIFYTALYHTMIQPNLAMDVDSMYRGRDNQVHKAQGFTYYSVFSLWDTFRAAHPLYTIIEQKRSRDFIRTFLAQYKEGGRLPVWELASNETDCMIGYHAVSVILDAAMKGIRDFDMNLALEAMQKSATAKRFGLPAYMDHGYLALEDEAESVSKTLEYAYDDWCIAGMAGLLNKQDVQKEYLKRSQNYRNLFDTETGFMRPRKNGCWLEPFDPREVNNNYTEANAWQYTFFVPHDLQAYMALMGGTEKFSSKLDSLFAASDKTTGRDQADISGMIGQYAHGNEPSHHIAYLYNSCCKPWKTQEIVHKILSSFYKASPDGLIGNEDCGQMSAWYVLSSMGFYPVTPGLAQYAIGTPSFSSVSIHLENGKTFSIQAKNVSPENYYVQSVSSSAPSFNPLVLMHQDILNGASLNFTMGSQPNTTYVSAQFCDTTAKKVTTGFVPAPVFLSTSLLFRTNAMVGIVDNEPGAEIYYTTDGSDPDKESEKYDGSVLVSKTTQIKAIAFSKSDTSLHSGITSGTFYKFPNWWTIHVRSHASAQYSAGGDETLIDGIRGDVNWRKGNWLGFQGKDFEAVVDLGKAQSISRLSAGFLQDENAWILMPREVDFFLSSDGKTFKHIVTVDNDISESDDRVQVKDFSSAIRKQKARYVKVRATNFGKLPEWHPGKGGEAFLFVDEISIE
ncbi:MAG TPA: GH92 family glycosyl hydrolase [Bacteroidia bacterium]|nr:GH92 family glycosyl hydrolase [Bacteroidia bacterium]